MDEIRKRAFGVEESKPENTFMEGAEDWFGGIFGGDTTDDSSFDPDLYGTPNRMTPEEAAMFPSHLGTRPSSLYYNPNEAFELGMSAVDPTLANYTGAQYPSYLDSQHREPTAQQQRVLNQAKANAINEAIRQDPNRQGATDRLDTRGKLLTRQEQEQQLGISQKSATSPNASQRQRGRSDILANSVSHQEPERAPYKRELLVELEKAKAKLVRHNNNPANIYDKVRTERGGQPSLIQRRYMDEIGRIQSEIDTMDGEAPTPRTNAQQEEGKKNEFTLFERIANNLASTPYDKTGLFDTKKDTAGEAQQNVDGGMYNEALNRIASKRGWNSKEANAFTSWMEQVGNVESGNKFDRTQGDKPEGIGRGAYQYEMSKGRGDWTNTVAIRRLKSTLKTIGMKYSNIPEADRAVLEKKDPDYSKLSEDTQKLLFLSDKNTAPEADLNGLVSGKISGMDAWTDWHWKGAAEDKPARQSHWKSRN